MPPESSPRSRASGRRSVILAAVLWSLSGVITKALEGLDGGTIAFYRGLFAGLTLLPFVGRSRMVFRPGLIPLVVLFAALTGLFIGAIKQTTAANAIFLQYSSAIWAVPLSLLILRERPDRRSLLGIGVAALGIVLIVALSAGEEPTGGGAGGRNDPLGIALALGSGLCYAAVAVTIRGLRGLDPMWLSSASNLGGALVLGLWLVLFVGAIPLPTLAQAAVLLVFGVVQMAIPYVLFARGLRQIPAPEAGLLSLIEPVLNPLWVLLFIGERPSGPTWIGGGFLLAGVALRYLPMARRTAGAGGPAPPATD